MRSSVAALPKSVPLRIEKSEGSPAVGLSSSSTFHASSCARIASALRRKCCLISSSTDISLAFRIQHSYSQGLGGVLMLFAIASMTVMRRMLAEYFLLDAEPSCPAQPGSLQYGSSHRMRLWIEMRT